MKLPSMGLRLSIFAAFVALSAFALAIAASAQDGTWQVVRADYGFRMQRADVTRIVRDLLSQGGVNGRIAVNNHTMGGDPAVGRDKTLRVFVKGIRGEEREFDYIEGGAVPVALFAVVRDSRDDHHDRNRDNDHDRFAADRDRGDSRDLTIVRAFYGVRGRTVNVTDLLQSMVRDGALSVDVNNRTMGSDPAVGADKVLIVVYKIHGEEQATVVGENNLLSLP